MNPPLFARVAAVAAASVLTVAAAVPAQAVGVDVWGERWAWEGPGVGQINQAESYVQTLDCRTVLAVETRADRASRFHRAEGRWPALDRYAAYPNNQRIISVLDVSHRPEGWTTIYSWTPGTGHSDLARVVWVPSCDRDRNPVT